jgi:xanthine dehydrogenase accessory factor
MEPPILDFPMSALKPCVVLEHLRTVRDWQLCGRRACIATLIATEGSAPRDPGATMAIAADGELCGSITGGCIEAALVDEANAVFAQRQARLARFGIADDRAQAIGLSCGGTIEVLIDEPDSQLLLNLIAALRDEQPAGIAMRLDAPGAGARLAVFSDRIAGSLGNAELDEAVAMELRGGGGAAETTIREFGENGEPHGDVRVFVQRIARKPRLYVFGAVDFAAAMLRVGTMLGYETILCDARPAFATRTRFPHADRIEVGWPDELLAREAIDERTAIVAMTHDEKFDVPLLIGALGTPAFYIGVMGSRRTNARRMAQLREAGVGEDELARLCAPAGLNVGGRTPEEIALSIGAEIVAVRNGREGGQLRDGEGPVRGRLHALR